MADYFAIRGSANTTVFAHSITLAASVSKSDEFCMKNKQRFNENEEFCIKNKEFCIKNDDILQFNTEMLKVLRKNVGFCL